MPDAGAGTVDHYYPAGGQKPLRPSSMYGWTGTLWLPMLVGADGSLAAALEASAASGGITTTARLLSAAATTNGTSVKVTPGRVYSIQGYNAATGIRYLKLYNKATAPTVGTDVPIKTLALPSGTGFALDWPLGYYFDTGIGFGLTTGVADNDTGALTLADVLGLNIDYV